MAMFSFFSKGRQAAKEHKAKKEKRDQEPAKVPYKHIPTHAATDALTSAPPSWRDDRRQVLEAHRRRSAMMLNQSAMSSTSDMNMAIGNPVHQMGGMPRTHSTLSHVAYPSAHASPVAPPRAYSYSGAPTGWSYHEGAASSRPRLDSRASWKGKEVDRRVNTVPEQPLSSTPSQEVPRTGSSSGDSLSSQDNLEMKTSHRHTVPVRPATGIDIRPQPEQFHRPYSGQSRNLSPPPGSPTKRTRPSVARASSDIPPVPQLPMLHFSSPLREGIAPSSPSTNSQSPSITTTMTDLTSLAAEKQPSPPSSLRTSYPASFVDASEPPNVLLSGAPLPHKDGRRPVKMARFSELETINSVDPPRMAVNQKTRPTLETKYLPTEFDFDTSDSSERVSNSIETPVPMAPQTPGKLSKSAGGKLTKKSRWSMSSRRNSVAV